MKQISTILKQFIVILLILLCGITSAFSANRKVFTGPGNFSDGTKWSGGSVPIPTDTLEINGTCTYDAGTNLTYGPLIVGGSVSGTMQWAVGGAGTLTVSDISSVVSASAIDMTNGGKLTIQGQWNAANQSFIAGTGTVAFNNQLADVTMPASVTTYNNITVSCNGKNVNLGGSITVNGNFLHSVGTFNLANDAYNMTLKGNLTTNAFLSGSPGGTVTIAGTTAQSLNGTSGIYVRFLTISNTSGIVSLTSGNLSILNTLIINANATLSVGSTTVINNFAPIGTITGSGTVQVLRTTVGTNDYANQLKFAVNTLSNLTIDYAGTSAQTISGGLSYGKLTISNTSATVSAPSNFNVTNTLNVKANAVFSPASTTVINNAASVGTITGSGKIFITGSNYASQYKFNTNTLFSLTTECNGPSSQTIGGLTFGNLIINNANGVALSSGTVVNGIVTLTSGTFTVGANSLTLNGGAIAGTLSNFIATSSSNILFGGATAGVSLPSGVTALNNFTAQNTNGVSLNGDLTVNGALSVTAGTLTTNSYTITLGASATIIESTGSEIVGNVTSSRNVVATSGTETFGGIGADVNLNGVALGNTTVTRVTGTPATGNGHNSISRYFDITPTVNTGLNAGLVFHFDPSELGGQDSTVLRVFKSTDGGIGWDFYGGIINALNHTITVTSINDFSRWTAADTNNNLGPFPVPATSSISPINKYVGDATFTLNVNGSNFVSISTVRVNGSNRATTFVNANLLTIAIQATDMTSAGTISITVFNPAPGGGESNAQTLTINNYTPTTSDINPNQKLVGDAAFTLTVNGSDFVPTSVVRFNGSDRTTSFVNANQITAAITTNDLLLAQSASITVFNPAPGGGNSNAQALTVIGGSISGTVYQDNSGNGNIDGSDIPLQNWKVKLSGAKSDSMLTDANGNFIFSNLSSGNYTLSEVIQPGWSVTEPSVQGTYPITIVNGSTLGGKNFGNFQYGKIKGIVFNDINGNGVKDVGESGMQNWKLQLSGSATDSILTDISGNYVFANLTVGTYTVNEVAQTGWIQTLPLAQGTYTIVTTSGITSSGNDFGNFQLGSISGTTYNDVNGNGIKEAGENALSGWKTYLYKPDTLTLVDSVISTQNGYTFSSLTVGTYYIREASQAGWTQSTTNPSPVSITSGSNIANNDFGNFQYGSVTGTIYLDANGNGTRDNGEAGLPQWVAALAGSAHTDSALTDANGLYTFNNILSGSYTLSEVLQINWSQSAPASPGKYFVTVLSGNTITGKDFGNGQLASISGETFNDANGNGVKDSGELPTSGWKIKLTGAKTDSVLTDNNGHYDFFNLTPAGYIVSEVLQANWLQTMPSAPGVYTLNLTPGQTAVNQDFGNLQLGTISGTVYLDVNNNGTLDNGEAPLANWKLHLNNGDSTLTDANGNYTFTNLFPASYTLTEETQQGFTQTSPAVNYVVSVTSGGTVTGKNFGNYGGITKFRTFKSEIPALAGKSIKLKYVKKTGKLKDQPVLTTAVEAVFRNFGTLGATFLGVEPPKDSIKKYAWIFFKKAAELGKLYAGPEFTKTNYYPIDYKRGFNKNTKLAKAIKPTRKDYDNPTFEQGVLFHLNLFASQYGITPNGYGDLYLDTSFTFLGKQLKGMQLKNMAKYFDTLMTYWKIHNLDDAHDTNLDELKSFIKKIIQPLNERFWVAFDASDTTNIFIDSVNIQKGNPYAIKLLGVTTASQAGIVREGVTPPTASGREGTEYNNSMESPAGFALLQNYPNPFNPTTTILFELPEAGIVSLNIYNTLGQEVQALINNQTMDEGEQEIDWNAATFSSGVYFYRLHITGESGITFTQTKRLLLIK